MLEQSCQQYEADQWRSVHIENVRNWIAEEVPIALVYNGISHAVMLASPQDLENFALGFSLSEMILSDPSELLDIDVVSHGSQGIEVQMKISGARFNDLKHRRRNLTGRTGCGICGAESLEQAIRQPLPVQSSVSVSAQQIHGAFKEMHSQQHLQAKTGAVHAAGWVDSEDGIRFIREDVGRHNALDKMIGMAAAEGVHFQTGFAIITSRASYEMVQKAATVGIPLLAAISAPTGLAIRLAEQTAVTLVGFARSPNHVVYTHPHRITK